MKELIIYYINGIEQYLLNGQCVEAQELEALGYILSEQVAAH